MSRSVIHYDRDLPEIPGRRSDLPPDSYLVKKSADEFELVAGRRPSKMLLVNQLRTAVNDWRSTNYPGASMVTRRLFSYWFEEEHLVGERPFRFYFGQREAIETLVYLIEIRQLGDAKLLVDAFAEIYQVNLLAKSIEHQTTMDGTRQVRRYVPELANDAVQDLPPADLARYAFKMATGSGKTVVMAMAMVWSYFHRTFIPGSRLSTNFLILAPNVIVYQRLEKDFGSNRVFRSLPLIPPEWSWNVKPILRGESTEPDATGNLFLTNIHQLYESRRQNWTPANAVEALLGRRPTKDVVSQQRSMLERVRELRDLVVLNDEAHHVHDDDLAWNQTLMDIHRGLPHGLAVWLDFSATPKDQNGTYYPWIICDYPLAQAVEDRIVKAPLIVHQVKRQDPQHVTRANVVEAYSDWLTAALGRWREHETTLRPLGVKPVLFIMAEKNVFADEIGKWLVDTKDFGLKPNQVLVIHTDNEGFVRTKDLEAAREAAKNIDDPRSPVKVIVSVMMLREGWDVRNVTVVLGLRPFTAKAGILPEQAVGRGLRLIADISPDQTQTLEVIGTQEFEKFVRELEVEGLGIRTVTTPPPPPIKIEPIQEKLDYDIGIPLTKPVYSHDYTKLSTLDPLSIQPLFDGDILNSENRIKLVIATAMTETEIHRTEVGSLTVPIAQEVLSTLTQKVMREAALASNFAALYPIVREYVSERCFGERVDLNDPLTRQFLAAPEHQQHVASHLARVIGQLTSETRTLEFEDQTHRLSQTQPFLWRRQHVRCNKTIFNYVATYNDFETAFAEFLDRSPDIERFAALAEHFTRFRVDYLSERGAIKFYYPDFVAVQQLDDGSTVNWILETKGRLFENVPQKDAAISDWCHRVSTQVNQTWRYVRVDQRVFERQIFFASFAELEHVVSGRSQPMLG